MSDQGLDLVATVLRRIGEHTFYGGVNGTCYECPFATPPLREDGRVADWNEVSNDPTEAYFRCLLPGRDNEAVVWGEYAPCSEREWAAAALEALQGAAETRAVRAEAVVERMKPVVDAARELAAAYDADDGYRIDAWWEILRAALAATGEREKT